MPDFAVVSIQDEAVCVVCRHTDMKKTKGFEIQLGTMYVCKAYYFYTLLFLLLP